MTAVATFPSVPRAGWTNPPQSQMSPDDIARFFMPRKGSLRGPGQNGMEVGGGVWNGGQLRGGAAHDGGPQGGAGNMKNKKPNRAAPWPPKVGMMGGTGGSHSVPSIPSTPSMNQIHQPAPILPSQHRGAQQSPISGSDNPGTSYLILLPLNNSFEAKFIPLPYYPETLRIGRQTNAKTLPNPSNGYFDSKVLSRQHAEVWAEPKTGKVWIRDVKSSNGTFVNGQRLSQENRDSEPHELRTEDLLELGIDIFSEDNKSIIHHKVAARVEHAGPQTGTLNLENLNLNLGDMDSIMGGGLVAPPINATNNNLARGRSASQTSKAGSVAGPNGVNRGVPLYLQSISVEQIVKKLNSELHLAKQQAQELQRTSEFFDQLLNLEIVRKEPEIKKAVVESGGQSPMIDSGVAFEASQFHAVPNAPLPPPAKHITVIPENVKLERDDHETESQDVSPPLSVSAPKRSPKSEQPQHLFSLVAQLRDARLELEAKSARVKDLEDLLRQERRAREMAEEQLEVASRNSKGEVRSTLDNGKVNGVAEEEGIPDNVSIAGSDITVLGPGDKEANEKDPSHEKEEQSAAIAAAAAAAAAEAAAQWQKRVEEMMAELQSAKAEIESYKKRVRVAEEEGEQSRRTLTEMVAKIRADEERRKRERKEISIQTESKNEEKDMKIPVMVSCGVQAAFGNNTETRTPSSEAEETYSIANGTVKATNGILVIGGGKNMQSPGAGHDQLLSTELMEKQSSSKRSIVKESAPYVSIVGVVVIGVSIMAILNNWQKGER
ncbi:hypothetical protein BDZ91DRAFT_694197 [Kalaharituber pfeilii]|nr:hypothetical protein BDZ91DRAFT_694197 [Kalaharituber pfeilii]